MLIWNRIRQSTLYVKYFFRNCRGGAAITVALAMVPMLLAAGGAIDFTRYYDTQQSIQTALDASVLAGAAADNDDSIAENTFSAWKVSFSGTLGSPSYTATDTDDASYYAGTVDAHLSMTAAALIGLSTLDFTVKSKAVRLKTTEGGSGTPCTWVGNGGMQMGGDARFMAPNCQMDIRGGAPNFESGSQVMTQRLCVGPKVTDFRHNGTIYDPNQSSPLVRNCAKPTSYTMPPKPTYSSCDHNDHLDYYYSNPNAGKNQGRGNSSAYPSYTSITLKPGMFCNGLKFHGSSDSANPMQVTLAPGLYIIKGAPFEFEGYISLYGYGVSFYFVDANSWLKFDDDYTTSELSAPTSGDCESDDRCGVLMFEPSSLKENGYSVPMGFSYGTSHAWTGNVMLPSRWIGVSPSSDSDAFSNAYNKDYLNLHKSSYKPCEHEHHMDFYGRMAVYGMHVCGDSRWRVWPRKTVVKEACPTPRPDWWPIYKANQQCTTVQPGLIGWLLGAQPTTVCTGGSSNTAGLFANKWWYSWWHYWRHDNEAPRNSYACTCPGPEGPSWTYGKFPDGTTYSPASWKNGRYAYPAKAPWPYHRPCACHAQTWHPWHKICEDDDGNYSGDGDGDGDDSTTSYSTPHLVE